MKSVLVDGHKDTFNHCKRARNGLIGDMSWYSTDSPSWFIAAGKSNRSQN